MDQVTAVVIGEEHRQWEKYLDVMVQSVVENGGRSCVNASGIWVPAHAEEIAEALAERLAKIVPRAAEDEKAQLAPFADANVATRISQLIDQGLLEPGVRDVTAKAKPSACRGAGVLTAAYRPSCDAPCIRGNKEFLFPLRAWSGQTERFRSAGPSRWSAITSDQS